MGTAEGPYLARKSSNPRRERAGSNVGRKPKGSTANLLVRSIAGLEARKRQLHFDEAYARRPEHLPVDL